MFSFAAPPICLSNLEGPDPANVQKIVSYTAVLFLYAFCPMLVNTYVILKTEVQFSSEIVYNIPSNQVQGE